METKANLTMRGFKTDTEDAFMKDRSWTSNQIGLCKYTQEDLDQVKGISFGYGFIAGFVCSSHRWWLNLRILHQPGFD